MSVEDNPFTDGSRVKGQPWEGGTHRRGDTKVMTDTDSQDRRPE